MAKNKCTICGATSSTDWEECCVCGDLLCDDCGIECEKCGKFYCIGKCGDDYVDEYEYNFCFNCK